MGSMWRSEESREVLTFGPRRSVLWSHSMVAIFKKSRLLVLLCFAQRWRVHAAHWVAACFVDVYFMRSQVVSIAAPHVLLCLHVSFSVLEASAGAWHQAHRGRVAFSRCHAMNVRCSDTPLVEKAKRCRTNGCFSKGIVVFLSHSDAMTGDKRSLHFRWWRRFGLPV